MTTVEKFKFETKSETLARLAKKGLTANILPFVYFEASEWLTNSDTVLERIWQKFDGHKARLAVRRSAVGEYDVG